MFRKTTFLISSIILLSSFLNPMELQHGKVEFKLVQEKQFDKKIKDVAWGETEDGKLYPKIVVFEDEVSFYDEEANLLASQPYQKHTRITISAKGNYVSLPTLIKHSTKEQTGLLEFTVYTEKGEKLWEREE